MIKININEIELQEGIITCNVDLTSELVKQLIAKYPELIKVVGSDTPSYFKCNKNDEDFGFTMGRIYKEDVTIPRITNCINLNSDRNKPISIYGHANSDTPSGFTSGFELATKEEWDKQEIMEMAIRNFPIGTKFKNGNTIQTVIDDKIIWHGDTIRVATDIKSDGEIYMEGKFAEILIPLFRTDDRVVIYNRMPTFRISEENPILNKYSCDFWLGKSKNYKYFYHKENALAYIEKHKEKSLEDYENILFERGNSMICSSGVVYFSVLGWLKDNEPKLYYTKILQLIADDLNDGRYIYERGRVSFHINKEGRVNLHIGDDEGAVYFKSKELAEKARAILGDNVKFLFS